MIPLMRRVMETLFNMKHVLFMIRLECCPILRQIYDNFRQILYIVLYRLQITILYKSIMLFNKERSKTIRNLTMPCINLSEYWTNVSD